MTQPLKRKWVGTLNMFLFLFGLSTPLSLGGGTVRFSQINEALLDEGWWCANVGIHNPLG